jgi:hypothetical protein
VPTGKWFLAPAPIRPFDFIISDYQRSSAVSSEWFRLPAAIRLYAPDDRL